MANAVVRLVMGRMTVSVRDGPGNPRDFVALYEIDAAHDNWFDWAYVANNQKRPIPQAGATAGRVTLNLPGKDGYYEVRLMTVGPTGYVELASGPEFSLGNPKCITLSPAPAAGTYTLTRPDGSSAGKVTVGP